MHERRRVNKEVTDSEPNYCDPGGNRTHDPHVRSVMLYPLSYGVPKRTNPILSITNSSVSGHEAPVLASRTHRRYAMPGKKKFGDDEAEPDRDHCPKCGVKLTQGEKDSERCRNGHALT